MPCGSAAALMMLLVGVSVAATGVYVRLRADPSLLANYTGATDPEYAAEHGGNAAAATGLVVAVYGAADLVWSLPAWTVAAVVGAGTVGAFWAAVRAQGV
ncbi:hypothetical protein [Halobacterium jilantaiense]|uniref:Uncharacterized protein n=1 Tax=Halobacterium jilantaiense TaxID=355548 RepID=A0A1I0PXP5_9EURY|nr:hypothetical protein [Halobacterium jilantaiense]SEW19227.1 hypothetical protein SAMN04487945_2066 [Halobacterium jilantaiense]